jgi:hypothetical protein
MVFYLMPLCLQSSPDELLTPSDAHVLLSTSRTHCLAASLGAKLVPADVRMLLDLMLGLADLLEESL